VGYTTADGARRRPTVPAILLFACLTGASALGGCATARNYDDPIGPVLTGRTLAAPVAASALRIVTFNLKFGKHVDAAAELLAGAGPLSRADVLLLQEMDEPATLRLAQALAVNYAYVPSAVHPSTRRDLGVAILSPWPIQDAAKVLLPHRHRWRKMRRSAARATLETGIGPVRVYAVHLETAFGLSGRGRREQAAAVLRDAADWNGPIVIAGDFNGAAGARTMATSGFAWLTRDVRNTSGPFDLDHILVRGLCPAGGPPAAKARADGISDHQPVWAVVRPCAS